MQLVIPASADLPYLFFWLGHGHSEEDRITMLSYIKAMLKDDLFEVEITPKRVHTWTIYIYHAASEGLLELHELGHAFRHLLAIQLRTELLGILSKSASRSIEASDADPIRRIKAEAACAKVDESELGYTFDSLGVIADGIANGDFLQATA